MTVLRNLISAFSLYSRIPMPHISYRETDMKYNLFFLPWVGAVIGGLEYLCLYYVNYFELPVLCGIAVCAAVPLLLTGGFHVDGFLDVQDALSSYKEPEEKLRILKDPHIGAFAVIRLLLISAIFTGSFDLILTFPTSYAPQSVLLSFPLARALCGICALTMKKAKENGMLQNETKSSSKGCLIGLFLELALCIFLLFYADIITALCLCAVAALFTLYYGFQMKKNFGGVTGDTAGYYITTLEILLFLTIAVRCVLCR